MANCLRFQRPRKSILTGWCASFRVITALMLRRLKMRPLLRSRLDIKMMAATKQHSRGLMPLYSPGLKCFAQLKRALKYSFIHSHTCWMLITIAKRWYRVSTRVLGPDLQWSCEARCSNFLLAQATKLRSSGASFQLVAGGGSESE